MQEDGSYKGYVSISGICNLEAIVSETDFMTSDWCYPKIGLFICDCPSAGHDIVMLDYSQCGKDGEPSVVHIDGEGADEITLLAKDFETFIMNLVNYDALEVED